MIIKSLNRMWKTKSLTFHHLQTQKQKHYTLKQSFQDTVYHQNI